MISCDAEASGTTVAVYTFTKGVAELTLCRHHRNEHGDRLSYEGWELRLIPSLPESMADESVDSMFSEMMAERIREYGE